MKLRAITSVGGLLLGGMVAVFLWCNRSPPAALDQLSSLPTPQRADGSTAVPSPVASWAGNPASGTQRVPAVSVPVRSELTQYPDVVLNRDPDLGTPHFVRRHAGYLSDAAPGAEPDAIVAALLTANARTFTLVPADIVEPAHSRLVRDITSRHSGMRSLTWQQQQDGIDIYGATFAINLTRDNRIVSVSSRALHLPEVRFNRRDAISENDLAPIVQAALGQGATLSPSNVPTPIWYPLDMISAVLSWDVYVDTRSESHRLIVRADTGQVAEDINLTWALEPATFNVYTNDSPEPVTPGPTFPTNVAPASVPRTFVTLSSLDTNASPQGWIPDGLNTLQGNNANVYADWDGNNVPDSPPPTGSPYRVFNASLDFSTNPTNSVRAAQIQAFYVANWFHDRLWILGFDEAAGNFQSDNYGRGGQQGDALNVEVQDNYAFPGDHIIQASYTGNADGRQGRVSISTSTAPPRRDGAFDCQVLIHEATHGVSTRLIGNGFGLTTMQARGLGEGWSDFFALALLSEPGDSPDGSYPFASYSAARFAQYQHTYFGNRRFPYSIATNMAPQSLADIDPNQMAFPADVPIDTYYASPDADAVHNIGEIWCLALWECRANLVARYGYAGNETMLQLVVDGMKLTPVNPTLLQARDAILLADMVNNGGANQIALWRGFAKRGLGWSAALPGSSTTVGTRESSDLPVSVQASVTEAAGDGDGFVEPGESGELRLTLTSQASDLGGLTATLSALSSNVLVVSSNAVFPNVTAGGSSTSSPPMAFTVSVAFPGNTDAEFCAHAQSDQGDWVLPLSSRIGNPHDYAPEIHDLAVTNITETNAWVRWTTSIPADGQVAYGTSTYYDAMTALDPTPQTNHVMELAGLSKGTVYHFRAVSRGTNNMETISPETTFRTRARIYVYAGSTATQELGTVDAPFKTLQAAAEAAKLNGDDILVAEASYTRSNPEAVLNLDGSDWALTVVGGYSPDFSVYDPAAYVVTLDGQLTRQGIRLDNGASLKISGVTITHGNGQWGGGVHVRAASRFEATSCRIEGNTSTNADNPFGGGVYATLGSAVVISDSCIVGNASWQGGGVFAIASGTLLSLRNCRIERNNSDAGGGVAIQSSASGDVTGCLVVSNKSKLLGGGIAIFPFSSAVIDQSTIAFNCATDVPEGSGVGGGGVEVAGPTSMGTLTLLNSVVFGNIAAYGADLHCGAQSETHTAFSCVGAIDGSLTSSNHLLRVDPRFANPAAGDFHLLYGSPCIDAGEPGAGGGIDMDGEPRPFGAAIDMGADEFTDADGDHMADYWEVQTFGSITNRNDLTDDDHDGLDDFNEYLHQTDPFNPDTDGDLAQDGWEVTNGYDPRNPDQDGDGMWDGWEVLHALDAFTNDAALDPDGDTANNQAEFTADTDPWDSNSVLRFLAIGQQWGGTRLAWHGGRDARQFLETSTDLPTTNWAAIYGIPPPTSITNSVIHLGTTNQILFYRIRAFR